MAFGARMDSAIYDGYTIPPYYDSPIGKLIVHARTPGTGPGVAAAGAERARGRWDRHHDALFHALLDEPDIQGQIRIPLAGSPWLAREG